MTIPHAVHCRTPEEYAQGHVPGSINVPIKLDDGAGGMVPNPEFLQQVGWSSASVLFWSPMPVRCLSAACKLRWCPCCSTRDACS